MKKLHILTISLIATALLACLCVSCVSASDNSSILGYGNADFTVTHRIISTDYDSGKALVEFDYKINPNGDDISNPRVVFHQLEYRCGGCDYKWIGKMPIDSNQKSGSFVRELDINNAYSLNLEYDYDGVYWDTEKILFDI